MNSIKEETGMIKTIYDAIEDKFGQDIVILDISEISTMANYFIITSGSNPNQIKAIADNVEQELAKIGIKLHQSEGYQSASWILLDFSDVIVHVFDKENRDFYNLERVWNDAKRININ